MSSELESIEEAQVNVNIAHPQIPQDVSVGVSLLLAVSIYKQLEIVCNSFDIRKSFSDNQMDSSSDPAFRSRPCNRLGCCCSELYQPMPTPTSTPRPYSGNMYNFFAV